MPMYISTLKELFHYIENDIYDNIVEISLSNDYSLEDGYTIDDIKKISSLERFINVKTLRCTSCKLTTLPTLPPNLEILYCKYNELTNLPDPLPPTLIELNCGVNQLTTLPPLPPTLKQLVCHENKLTTLPPLPPTLIELECQRNQLTTLPPLPPLIKLNCGYNQLTTLPEPLPSTLKDLTCQKNQLTTLPEPLPSTLDFLNCGSNQLTTLPEPLPSLKTLYCHENRLTTLPPLPPTLKDLNCSDNRISYLPEPLPQLYFLKCDDNNLPFYDLTSYNEHLDDVNIFNPTFFLSNPESVSQLDDIYSEFVSPSSPSSPLSASTISSGSPNYHRFDNLTDKRQYINDYIIEKDCIICTQPLNSNKPITLGIGLFTNENFDCSHIFHTICIHKWLKINIGCPICRRDFL